MIERDVVEKDLVGKNLIPFGPFDPDIPPGMVGVDGTETLVDAFTALTWGAGTSGTEVVQPDGTVVETLPAGGGAASFTSPLVGAPMPGGSSDKVIEVRFRLADSTKPVELALIANDGNNEKSVVFRGGLVFPDPNTGSVVVTRCVGNDPERATIFLDLSVMRTYSFRMPAGQGTPELRIDGVLQALTFVPGFGFCTDGGPLVTIAWNLLNDDVDPQDMIVDFMRWTAPV